MHKYLYNTQICTKSIQLWKSNCEPIYCDIFDG